jgi:formylglycine-generating enzyme required for sulfatase activity
MSEIRFDTHKAKAGYPYPASPHRPARTTDREPEVLRRRLEYAWNEISRLTQALERARDQGPPDANSPPDGLQSLRDELETLRQALSHKTAELESAAAEHRRLESQLQALTSECSPSSAQLDQTSGELEGPGQVVESARSALDTATMELGTRETELQALETELQLRASDLEAVQQSLEAGTRAAGSLPEDPVASPGSGAEAVEPTTQDSDPAPHGANPAASEAKVGTAEVGSSGVPLVETAPPWTRRFRVLWPRNALLWAVPALLVLAFVLRGVGSGDLWLFLPQSEDHGSTGAMTQPLVDEPYTAVETPSEEPDAGTASSATPHQAGSSRPRRPVVRDRLAIGFLGPELVAIGPGSFEMGSPSTLPYPTEWPQHQVQVGRILMGTREVSFAEFDLFARTTGADLPSDFHWGRGKRPVVGVSWDDANAYTTWLSRQTGHRYRLPSEAEWEYAARGNNPMFFWWGSEPRDGRAVCFDCGTVWDNRMTVPVASFAPNPFGLYDTTGNVMEWVGDCWNLDYTGAPTDARIRTDGDCTMRVARGGAFNRPALSMRSAARFHFPRETRVNMLGFRVARDL